MQLFNTCPRRNLASHAYFILMTGFFLLACARVAEPTTGSCGDNVCDSSETKESCPDDCPTSTRCGDAQCSAGETRANCPSDCIASCGNRVCDNGETSTTCTLDCPSTRCGDGLCSGSETTASCATDCSPQCEMANPATCAGDTICLDGTCRPAFSRFYRFGVYDATFATTDGNGQAWDVDGSAPDPFFTVSINGTLVVTSSKIDNVFSFTWNEASNPTVLAAGSTVTFDFYDSDVAVDELIASCEFSPLTADRLHAGQVQCVGSQIAATLLFLAQ